METNKRPVNQSNVNLHEVLSRGKNKGSSPNIIETNTIHWKYNRRRQTIENKVKIWKENISATIAQIFNGPTFSYSGIYGTV